jgi:hypothetical protein
MYEFGLGRVNGRVYTPEVGGGKSKLLVSGLLAGGKDRGALEWGF